MNKRDLHSLRMSIRKGMIFNMREYLVPDGVTNGGIGVEQNEWESDTHTWRGPEVLEETQREFDAFVAWMHRRGNK